jgi:hypothetical protein
LSWQRDAWLEREFSCDPDLTFPPTTPPARHQSPRSLSRYAQLQQSPDSFNLPDPLVRERERRPSLAASAVSGMSGLSRKSNTLGSWDGYIYDNCRYSAFSAGSSMTGVGRPSIDSTRPRTDSAAGRIRLESTGTIQNVAEEAESADLPAIENQSSPVVDADASFYSQDCRLSALPKEITSLASSDSNCKQSAAASRPSPLSIPTLEEIPYHSPLLRTDRASPTSPASTVQAAFPPPTASIYLPHLRQNNAAAVPKTGHTMLSQAEDNGTEATGMASWQTVMRVNIMTVTILFWNQRIVLLNQNHARPGLESLCPRTSSGNPLCSSFPTVPLLQQCLAKRTMMIHRRIPIPHNLEYQTRRLTVSSHHFLNNHKSVISDSISANHFPSNNRQECRSLFATLARLLRMHL